MSQSIMSRTSQSPPRLPAIGEQLPFSYQPPSSAGRQPFSSIGNLEHQQMPPQSPHPVHQGCAMDAPWTIQASMSFNDDVSPSPISDVFSQNPKAFFTYTQPQQYPCTALDNEPSMASPGLMTSTPAAAPHPQMTTTNLDNIAHETMDFSGIYPIEHDEEENQSLSRTLSLLLPILVDEENESQPRTLSLNPIDVDQENESQPRTLSLNPIDVDQENESQSLSRTLSHEDTVDATAFACHKRPHVDPIDAGEVVSVCHALKVAKNQQTK